MSKQQRLLSTVLEVRRPRKLELLGGVGQIVVTNNKNDRIYIYDNYGMRRTVHTSTKQTMLINFKDSFLYNKTILEANTMLQQHCEKHTAKYSQSLLHKRNDHEKVVWI